MQIENITLPNLNKLVRDYKNHDEYMLQFFDYQPFPDTFEERLHDLNKRTFQRKELADVLLKANRAWGASEETIHNIKRLELESSVAVIGGQQAGLLTGPLYTVNKIISIIQLARKQEKELGVPVVPVFWIAGEDHDFEEVNHVYMFQDGHMEKKKLGQYINEKRSVSYIEKDAKQSMAWLSEVFAALPETMRTKSLYEKIKDCLEAASTYVDFFAKLIMLLFGKQGIVLLDSADPEIRHLEKDYFANMIANRRSIAESVHRTKEKLEQAGYHISLDAGPDDGNLFVQHEGQRILLQVDHSGHWVGKQGEVRFSEEELTAIAQEEPERLSNNVVTRPLMQECLIPTLVFIGGNGEISYWSALKQAFHTLHLKMPPVLPRLSFTYSDQKIDKVLQMLNMQHEEVITEGVRDRKANWLKAQTNPPLDHLFALVKESIAKSHEPIRELAADIRSDLGQMSESNLIRIQREIDFLHGKMARALEQKYAKKLSEFDFADACLLPFGGLQERVWNPLSIINQHGTEFIDKLAACDCSFQEDHYIVHI